IGLLEAQVVEQVAHVLDHVRPIRLRVVGLLAPPVAAVVESDHPPAGAGQCLDPTRADPVDLEIAAEPVHEHRGRPVLWPLQVVMDSNAVTVEIGHEVRRGYDFAPAWRSSTSSWCTSPRARSSPRRWRSRAPSSAAGSA